MFEAFRVTVNYMRKPLKRWGRDPQMESLDIGELYMD